jgi:hypothetical protein
MSAVGFWFVGWGGAWRRGGERAPELGPCDAGLCVEAKVVGGGGEQLEDGAHAPLAPRPRAAATHHRESPLQASARRSTAGSRTRAGAARRTFLAFLFLVVGLGLRGSFPLSLSLSLFAPPFCPRCPPSRGGGEEESEREAPRAGARPSAAAALCVPRAARPLRGGGARRKERGRRGGGARGGGPSKQASWRDRWRGSLKKTQAPVRRPSASQRAWGCCCCCCARGKCCMCRGGYPDSGRSMRRVVATPL